MGEKMFGYVSCDEEKLTAQERDLVGSFYCGLCMALKSTFGNFARAFTNMDCAYAYMLIVSAGNCEIDLQRKRCFLHPFSKRNIAYLDADVTKKIASATVLISYFKILDDCKDEKKSTTKRMLKSFYRKTAGKAMQILPQFKDDLEKCLLQTQECERAGGDSLQKLMSISGEILASMARNCGAPDLEQLFFELGRFIYLMDAVDDYESDAKKKRFNALNAHLGVFNTKKEFLLNKCDELNAIYDEVKTKLVSAYDEIKGEEPNPIFDNLFTFGLDKTFLNARKVD